MCKINCGESWPVTLLRSIRSAMGGTFCAGAQRCLCIIIEHLLNITGAITTVGDREDTLIFETCMVVLLSPNCEILLLSIGSRKAIFDKCLGVEVFLASTGRLLSSPRPTLVIDAGIVAREGFKKNRLFALLGSRPIHQAPEAAWRWNLFPGAGRAYTMAPHLPVCTCETVATSWLRLCLEA